MRGARTAGLAIELLSIAGVRNAEILKKKFGAFNLRSMRS